MLNERIKKFIREGEKEATAILMDWNNVDRKSLSFEQLQRVWMIAPSGTPRKFGIGKCLKEKAKTFNKRRWLWEQTPFGTPEEEQARKFVGEKAETLKQLKWVWTITPSGTPEEAEAWRLVKEKVGEILHK